VPFEYMTTRVSHRDHTSHTFCFFCCCVFKTVLFFVVACDGGLAFRFFVAPSLAVFRDASVFNSDVSKWDTGAVATMFASKCTLSPSFCGHAFHLCATTRVLSDHNSHTFCSFVFPVSYAVFYRASAFNQDVSKWNTGAVTTMAYSKCTLLFRFVATRLHAFSLVVYFVNTYTTTKLESHQHRITLLTRFVALVFCGSETVPFSHVHVHVPFMLFCGLVSILFFVAPSLLLCSV